MKYLFRKAISGACLFLAPVYLLGFHLIGGDLTFTCLGNGDYAFTAHLYRDCNCVMCGNMPPFLPIAIFECGTSVNCRSLSQGNQKYSLIHP